MTSSCYPSASLLPAQCSTLLTVLTRSYGHSILRSHRYATPYFLRHLMSTVLIDCIDIISRVFVPSLECIPFRLMDHCQLPQTYKRALDSDCGSSSPIFFPPSVCLSASHSLLLCTCLVYFKMYVHFLYVLRYAHTFWHRCRLNNLRPYSLDTHIRYVSDAITVICSMPFIPPPYPPSRRCPCGANVPLRFVQPINLRNKGWPYYCVCLLTFIVHFFLISCIDSVQHVGIGIAGVMVLVAHHAILQRHHPLLIKVSQPFAPFHLTS